MNFLQGFSSFLHKFITIIFAIFVSWVIFANLISFSIEGLAKGIIYFLLVTAFAALAFLVYKKKLYKKKSLWITLFVVGAIAKILYSIFMNCEPAGDSKYCLNAAQSAANGDYSWLNEAYFKIWSFQLPFVFYETIVLSIFKSVKALLILDAIWSILTCFFIYKIAEKISKNKLIALIVASLYMYLPSSFLQIGILYNQVLCGFLITLGIYCFLCAIEYSRENTNVKVKYFLLSLVTGVVLGLGQLFRQEAIIILLACLCYSIYSCVKLHNNQQNRIAKDYFYHITNIIISLVLILFAFYLTTNIADTISIASGITENGFQNNCKYWHIICGLTPDSYGQYSETYKWIIFIDSPEAQKEAFKEIMSEIFTENSLLDTVIFFIKKLFSMWGTFSISYGLPSDSITDKAITLIILAFDKFFYILFAFLALLGTKLDKNKSDNEQIFMMIAFIGFFMAFIVKEIGNRYRYNPILLLALLSVFGLIKIKEIKANRQNALAK